MTNPMDQSEMAEIPLFPLPNVVLFPQAVLPLHIFEARYKVMVADALRGSRRIAMALLQPGWEKNYHCHPGIDPTVCVGTILSHERLADGRYNLLLQGTTRATIIEEVQDQPYRLAKLDPVIDIPVMEIDLADERRRLIDAFEDQRLLETGIGRRFHELLKGDVSTSTIADLIAFNFLEDLNLKQSLLADNDVRHRVARTVRAFTKLRSFLQELAPANFCKDPSLN
jgi:Lon protease-like protein